MSETVGLARTSTADQEAGLAAQKRDLLAAGCTRIYAEHVSAVAARRPQFEAAMDYVREGDTLVVTKPCRLARSMMDLMTIIDRLKAKKVTLRVLSMGMDTSTPTAELMLHVLGAVASFERSLMLERQREGIAKARENGKYLGRAPTARRQAAEVQRLLADGARPVDVARKLGISRASVYRVSGNGAAMKDSSKKVEVTA